MPITYKDIHELGVDPVPLTLLHPDHQTAKIMAFQCSGKIDFNENVVNADHGLAEKKHKKFFALAREKNASLAITPEYSCPWSVVETILFHQELAPHPGSLLVIGCEAITIEEFRIFREGTEDLVNWHFENVVPAANQKFLSPVVYLLHAQEEQEGQTKLCAIVQFKCHDMGGTFFERDNLIKGSVRYVLHNRNQPESIRLLTLICADVFTFDVNDLIAHLPHLVIHIQLNTEPYHHRFCSYRTEIFNCGHKNNCEILCLNWGQGFEFVGGARSADHGGSAYYMQPQKIEKEPNQSDNTINKNHEKGMYLRFSEKSFYSAFLFTPKEMILEFETTKASQFLAPPTHDKKSGPQVTMTYGWDSDHELWGILEKVDDGVKTTFEVNGGTPNITPSEREKLLVISSGRVSPDLVKWHMPKGLGAEDQAALRINYWHKARNMSSYCLDGYETPKGTLSKLHGTQDAEINESISTFSNLKGYLANTANLPDILEDYKTAPVMVQLEPNELTSGKIRHNVVREDGFGLSTIADIGATLPLMAQRKFNDIKDTLAPQRLVVWYTHEGQLKHIADELPSVLDAGEFHDDITRI